MLRGLNHFFAFLLSEFLAEKRLAYIKAVPWRDGDIEMGSKVILLIIEDKTSYTQPDVTNFGEQLTVKVRGVHPSAYNQLRPFNTEVCVNHVERAVVYGEYRNQLSIIGSIAIKEPPKAKT